MWFLQLILLAILKVCEICIMLQRLRWEEIRTFVSFDTRVRDAAGINVVLRLPKMFNSHFEGCVTIFGPTGWGPSTRSNANSCDCNTRADVWALGARFRRLFAQCVFSCSSRRLCADTKLAHKSIEMKYVSLCNCNAIQQRVGSASHWVPHASHP